MNLKELKELNIPELNDSEIENVIENVKSLNKEDKEDYLYYLMDDVYSYEEDKELDEINNRKVITIFKSVDKEEINNIQKDVLTKIKDDKEPTLKESTADFLEQLKATDRSKLNESELKGLDALIEYEENKLEKTYLNE